MELSKFRSSLLPLTFRGVTTASTNNRWSCPGIEVLALRTGLGSPSIFSPEDVEGVGGEGAILESALLEDKVVGCWLEVLALNSGLGVQS
jgi:hypothetical protein